MDKHIKNILINCGYSIREYKIITKVLRGEQITEEQKNEVQYILDKMK